MTVMDPRPWSPASAHIGPDDADLEMLTPTGDPEADLGSAVLAVHRVGGAAAEAVARAPLPDEFRLIEALAQAREALAPRAVEAVSKCLGREDAYPDLLLRDLFDAGEAGALAVYRACVSKGVAPPLAAQRAGLVYGVPQGELGRFLSIATEPKSHPVAIADAADRAVTRWASGVVRDEVGDVVSKRTVTQYNTTTEGHVHPKGRDGEFVRVLERTDAPTRQQVAGQPAGFLARLRRDAGYGGQAAPEVAVEPAVAPPVEVATPTRPPARQVRAVRAHRKVRSTAPSAAVTPARMKASLNSKLKGTLGARLKARLDSQRAKPSGEERLEEADFGSESEISGQFTHRITGPLAWSMPLERANEIFHDSPGAGTYDKPKHVQMGQLQQILSEPLEWRDQHHEQMRNLAEDVAGDQRPRFVHINGEELEANGVPAYGPNEREIEKGVRDYARMAGYFNQLARDPDGTANPMLAANMGLVPSADPGTGDWYLVLNPEPVVYGDPEGAPLPAAAELVVMDDMGGIRANIEGSGRQTSYELDPTQFYTISEPRTLWKQTSEDSGYWVDRYSLTPLDDNFRKAAPVMERWRTEPRNEAGEWTSGGFLARVATKPAVEPEVRSLQPRQARKIRAQRKVRQLPAPAPTQAELAGSMTARLPAQLKAKIHAALQSAVEEVADEQADLGPVLDDTERYKVFTAAQWQKFATKAGYRGFADPGTLDRLAIRSDAKRMLLESEMMDGDQADAEMRVNVEQHILEHHHGARRQVPTLARNMNVANKGHWRNLLNDIQDYMDENPSVVSAMIDMKNLNHETHYADVVVRVNVQPVPTQALVVFPDDFDPEKPMMLRWEKTMRQHHFTSGVRDTTLQVDAPLQVYRVTRAQQEVWMAEED